MLNAFEETGEAFFLLLARSFLGRMENDLNYQGGTDEQVIAVMDKNLYTTKIMEELRTHVTSRRITLVTVPSMATRLATSLR